MKRHKKSQQDPQQSTREQRAVTESMGEQLKRELEKIGISEDEWKARYNEILSQHNLSAVSTEAHK